VDDIRFEKFYRRFVFTLKASGCIAVSGGLEVPQIVYWNWLICYCRASGQSDSQFYRSRVMVHAYLMYGYPTQTIQETVDSLKWFVNCSKQEFTIRVLASICHDSAQSCWNASREIWCSQRDWSYRDFANNDNYKDSTGIDHDKFSFWIEIPI
jgi:hypothetical protein